MEEKSLLLEGLPGDLDLLRTKLELYFKNKRKSGGEVTQIREHPEDKRKALLIYLLDADLNNVLKQGMHKIDFKGHGTVELTVKPLNVTKVKPPVLPRPKLETLEHIRSAQPPPVPQKYREIQKGNEENPKPRHLLISTEETVDKEILAMYFEQFTEKAEMTKHGKNKWILKVANQSDVLTILDQKEHDFGLTVKVYKEADVEKQCDPRRFILTGFKDTCQCKLITMYIGSCSQQPVHTWEIVDDERIVVTFKEDIDSKSFLEKCAAKNLQGMEIEASHLEFTDSILVQGDMSMLTEDMLTLYFSNSKRSGGGDIRSLFWVNKEKSAVISFEDCHVAQGVVDRKHQLCGTDLSTLLFYSSLQKVLTGETPVCSNISTNTVIPVDEAVRSFIEKNKKHKDDFESQLMVVHANVVFDKTTSPREIALEMAVDKESLGALRLGPTWESKAQREAQAFLSRYGTDELQAEVEIWKRIEHQCLELVNSDVEVTYKETKIAIVGLKTEVSSNLDKIRNLCEDASAELEVERNTVEKVIQFDSKETLQLVEKRVYGKLQTVTLTKNETNLTFHLGGLRDCVSTAESTINQAQEEIIFQQPNLSDHLLQFLMSLDLKKFEQDHFVKVHLTALFRKDEGILGLVTEKKDLEVAEDVLKNILQEEIIQLTPDVNTGISSDKWLKFLNELKAESNHISQKVNIIPSEAQIVICGFADVVRNVTKKIKAYLENKTPATEYVHLKSLHELEYVDSCMNLSENQEIRNLGVIVQSCRTSNSPHLKVTASKEKIQDIVSVVKKLISPILTEKHTFSKAGESKVIFKHEATIQAKAKECHCNAHISNEKSGPSKQYTHKINSHMTLTVTEGDLQHLPADALICPMNSKLAFDNPVAQKFLQVAGSDIQVVCTRLQKEKQSLLAGDVVLSDPGNLSAKSLIYTVLPQSGQQLTSVKGSHYLKEAVLNSLQKAESQNDTSIAMPVIGCGTFGFSTKESCMAIRDAVLEFNNQQQNSQKNIKNIFVVDSNVKVLEEFNDIIAKLGFSNVKASTMPTSTTSQVQPKSVHLKQTSDTEVTVHGVLVSLKKGDITKEIVDVIVNSNNKALDLDTGVSGAILKAAGQSVVDECKKHGQQKDNGVVLTSGGNLSCKHIAQMVGPSNAADITSSVENVLKLCETTVAATVAIPAIGTGRGGIGAKDSIKAILAGMQNHLMQSTSSSLQKVTVVAFEQKVLDAYCSYFKKRNSKTARTNMPANKVKIGDVWIEIKKGNITIETVRGIVNTTNNQMNLTGGVSGAIFKAAGPSVQQECQNHGPLQGDTAAVTSGGNLQCDFIIHMIGPHSAKEARSRVMKVLERCEENQISTISFPAVGTGGGGVNSVDAINAMLQGFHDHLSQLCPSSTALKLIYIVVDRDEVLKAFLQGLNQWSANPQQVPKISEDEESSSSEEEDDSNEVSIGRISVKVLCGDITKETTDAIVSSTNTNLNLNTGVSGAILKAAGQTVMDECNKLGVQPSDGVVLTSAGNLPTKHIIHMVGQSKEKDITNSMYKVLKKCEENKLGSVSFPALGTGAGNLAAAQVAKAMMDALANFTIDSPAFLKTVQIVIFQSTMLSDFEGAMKTLQRNSQTPSSVNIPTFTQQTATDSTNSKVCLVTETAAVTFPVTNVEIYGMSSVDIAKVKKFLDDLLSEERLSKDVQSSHLANITEADNKAIVELSKRKEVHVLVAAKDKLTVSGRKEDVLDTVIDINAFLRAAQDREFRKNEEKRLSKTLRWEVAEAETWVPLSSSISYELELAFHKEQKFSYKDKGETFTVDFKEMRRVNSKGKSCKIKRTLFADSETAIIQPPPTWTKMDRSDLEIILSPGSDEYKRIEKEFLRSSKHKDVAPVEVVEIRRIQSQPQWQRYCVLKQAVDKKYPKQTNERFLYHGTTSDICQKINRNGFNRSFCGRNAVVHGDGTYFAKEAWYSCQDQYSNPDANGLKYIYRARVVTGSPCKSQRGMKEPDPLNPNDPSAGLYDCAVDNLQKPFIFVVFCDAGAYPDYLISFKSV